MLWEKVCNTFSTDLLTRGRRYLQLKQMTILKEIYKRFEKSINLCDSCNVKYKRFFNTFQNWFKFFSPKVITHLYRCHKNDKLVEKSGSSLNWKFSIKFWKPINIELKPNNSFFNMEPWKFANEIGSFSYNMRRGSTNLRYLLSYF